MVYPYGTTVVCDRPPEGVVCNRNSFCHAAMLTVSIPVHAQNMSRYLGDDDIYGRLRVPFDLIGMGDAVLQLVFPLGWEGNSVPFTLEWSDITGVYSSFLRQCTGLYDLASTKHIYWACWKSWRRARSLYVSDMLLVSVQEAWAKLEALPVRRSLF
jgi:hypothetical protein